MRGPPYGGPPPLCGQALEEHTILCASYGEEGPALTFFVAVVSVVAGCGRRKGVWEMNGNAQRDLQDVLRDYFVRREEVLLAYLFGSHARGEEQGSDYDFGVLLRAGTDPDCRHVLAHELGSLLGTQAVDVILLREAPVELAYNIISEGVLVFERDRAERVEFEASLMAKYCDFLPVLRRQREDVLREAGA